MEIAKLHEMATYFESIGSWHMAEIIRKIIAQECGQVKPLRSHSGSTASAIMDRKCA